MMSDDVIVESAPNREKAPETTTTDCTKEDVKTLKFKDYVDLTTRLVLLPKDDEVCIGAVIASYTPPTPSSPAPTLSLGNKAGKVVVVEEEEGAMEEVDLSEEKKEHEEEGEEIEDCFVDDDDDEINLALSTSNDATLAPSIRPTIISLEQGELEEGHEKDGYETLSKKEEEKVLGEEEEEEEEDSDTQEETDDDEEEEDVDEIDKNVNVSGYILIGMKNSPTEDKECWTKRDFTSILSTIREAPSPIVLYIKPPPLLELPPSPPPQPPPPERHSLKDALKQDILTSTTNVFQSIGGGGGGGGKPPLLPQSPPPVQRASLSSVVAKAKKNNPDLKNSLSYWKSCVKTVSEKVAAETKSRAASLSVAVAEKVEEIQVEQQQRRLESMQQGQARLKEQQQLQRVVGGGAQRGEEKHGEGQMQQQQMHDERNAVKDEEAVETKNQVEQQIPQQQTTQNSVVKDELIVETKTQPQQQQQTVQTAITQTENNNNQEQEFETLQKTKTAPKTKKKRKLPTIPPPTCCMFLQQSNGKLIPIENTNKSSQPPSPIGSPSKNNVDLHESRSCASLDGSNHSLPPRSPSLTTVGTPPKKSFGALPMKRTSSWNHPSSSGSSLQPPPQQQIMVTNMSVLSIRQSVDTPCPTVTKNRKNGYTFQWYRSYTKPTDNNDKKRKQKEEKEDVCWYELPGAVHAAFQPSATDVGHYIRCVVTNVVDEINNQNFQETEEEEEDYNTFDSESESDSDSSSSSSSDEEELQSTTICELPFPITADKALFNAARQNLLGGATFSNMRGCGYADGRMFRLKVELDYGSKNRKGVVVGSGGGVGDVTSVLSIYQVSGQMAELIHDKDDKIIDASAVADPSQARSFDLLFPSGLPSSGTMISALSKNGRFQLQAPNRVTRESFLLSLGIANFKGRVCDLNVNTVLFFVPPPDICTEACLDDEAKSCLSGVDIKVNMKTSPEDGSFEGITNSVDVDSTSKIGYGPEKDDMSLGSASRVRELELELQNYRKKLAAKDRVVSDLQRKLAYSDSQLSKVERELVASRSEIESGKAEYKDCFTRLRLAEKRIETHESNLAIVRGDHNNQITNHESEIKDHVEKAAVYEKTIKSLQNEKAVLSAAVESRDNKLLKMSELQGSVVSLKMEVAKGDSVRRSLALSNTRHAEIAGELEKAKASENECRAKLVDMKQTIEQLNEAVSKEEQRSTDLQGERDAMSRKFQQLKTERNSFKQKSESLSKEMSRICRNGMEISDIEKMMEDQESMKIEVELLKKQKRSALEEAEEYRTAYEQCVQAREKAGVDGDAIRALEQRAEMERVVANLTEHITAKEMQLETLQEVNRALSEEVHKMAQANLANNDI